MTSNMKELARRADMLNRKAQMKLVESEKMELSNSAEADALHDEAEAIFGDMDKILRRMELLSEEEM